MTRSTFAARSLAALTLALIGACDHAPTTPLPMREVPRASSDASAAGASAFGAGTITFGASTEHISFNARSLDPLTFLATGQAHFRDVTAAGVFTGRIDINCLNVIANYAIISGIVTQSSDPAMEGRQGIFAVVDADDAGNRSARDFMSLANFYAVGTGVDCTEPSEFDLAPLRGNVTVRM